VIFRVTLVSGVNAVVSGFFVDGGGAPPTSPNTASFVRIDGTTQGTWRGVYGREGTSLVAETSALPAYAQLASTGQAWTWTASTSDVRALQRPSGSDRFAATWYGNGTFAIDLNLTDARAHQIALYAIDWDSSGRIERIDVLDASTNAVLDSRTLTDFVGGQYVVWTVTGHVVFRVTRIAGVNPVVSGVFVE